MQYNGKEITSQEALDLLAEKDQQLTEKDEKITKLEEEKAADDAAGGDQAADDKGADDKSGDSQAADDKGADDKSGDSQAADDKAGDDKGADSQNADSNADDKAKDNQMSEEVKRQLAEKAEENRKLNERVVMLEERDRKSSIDTRLKSYTEKGVPPAIIEEARKIMLADKGEMKVIKLTEDKKEVQLSVSESLCRLLDVVSGIEFSEETTTDVDGSSDVGDKGQKANKERDQKIREYMEKNNGITYYEAYLKLLSDKQIDAVKVV